MNRNRKATIGAASATLVLGAVIAPMPSWAVSSDADPSSGGFTPEAPLPQYGHDPVGNLDSAKSVKSGRLIEVVGWAADPDVPNAPVGVTFTIDGKSVKGGAVTHIGRADATAEYPGIGDNAGFEKLLSTRGVKSGTHEVCATTVNIGDGSDAAIGCVSVDVTKPAVTKPKPAASTAAPAPAPVVHKTHKAFDPARWWHRHHGHHSGFAWSDRSFGHSSWGDRSGGYRSAGFHH